MSLTQKEIPMHPWESSCEKRAQGSANRVRAEVQKTESSLVPSCL